MFEKDLKIKLVQNKFAYCTLTQTNIKKCNKIIVFIHGLFGHKDEHLFFNGAKYFSLNGYDTLRYNQYSSYTDARKLDNGIPILSNDLNQIIKYLSKSYKQINIITHSFGCHIANIPNLKLINKIIFWEPSYDANLFLTKGVSKKKDKSFDLGYKVIVANSHLGEAITSFYIDHDNKNKYLIISNKNNESSLNFKKKYFNRLKISIIGKNDHNFDMHKNEQDLFKKSLYWLTS